MLRASTTVIRSFVVQASSSAQPVNNDGLTKQQLDLIHQIMQQTQQQAAAHQKHQQNSNSSTKNSVASNSTTSSVKTVTSSNKSRTWAVQVGRPHGCSVCETENCPEN
jgi:adenine C2-methylase RlmN of 23S rRNA A2503 and tRNA A37